MRAATRQLVDSNSDDCLGAFFGDICAARALVVIVGRIGPHGRRQVVVAVGRPGLKVIEGSCAIWFSREKVYEPLWQSVFDEKRASRLRLVARE